MDIYWIQYRVSGEDYEVELEAEDTEHFAMLLEDYDEVIEGTDFEIVDYMLIPGRRSKYEALDQKIFSNSNLHKQLNDHYLQTQDLIKKMIVPYNLVNNNAGSGTAISARMSQWAKVINIV